MKCCLFLLMFCCGIGNIKGNPLNISYPFNSCTYANQNDPFYFLKSVPSTILVNSNIDLSFFRNKLIVFQYRYRVEIPGSVETTLDQELITWSQWINYDFVQFLIPVISRIGAYKFVIEFKTSADGDIKVFEKLFYAYEGFTAAAFTKPADSKPGVTATTKNIKEARPVQKTVDRETSKNDTIAGQTDINLKPEKLRVDDLENLKIDLGFKPKVINSESDIDSQILSSKISVYGSTLSDEGTPSYKPVIADTSEVSIPVGDKPGDKSAVFKSFLNLLNNSYTGNDFILAVKNNDLNVNETDDEGNSLLHLAILAGKNKYARELILNGANMNISNNNKLSPLHLAVFLRDYESVNDLLENGADPNISGNCGYTPLHIAAEMNYPEIAGELLSTGALKGYKTSQGLTPRTIALIQKNNEIMRLLRTAGKEPKASRSALPPRLYNDNTDLWYRPVDFNLPYENLLVKRRKIVSIIQTVAAPVFAAAAGNFIYSRSEADKYFSLSKVADSEDIARYYYDKMNKYYRVSIISGGISLVAVYGVIHSGIIKKNISHRMRKIFN